MVGYYYVHPELIGKPNSFLNGLDSDLTPVGGDESYFLGSDPVVDPWFLCDRSTSCR